MLLFLDLRLCWVAPVRSTWVEIDLLQHFLHSAPRICLLSVNIFLIDKHSNACGDNFASTHVFMASIFLLTSPQPMLPLGLLHHNVPPSRMVRRWSLKHGFTVAVSGLMPHVRGI